MPDLDRIEVDRKEFARFWQGAIASDRLEILVHLRNADDIQALIAENNALRDQIKKLQRDVLTWTNTGTKYLEALDELRELKKVCDQSGIDFDFRSLR